MCIQTKSASGTPFRRLLILGSPGAGKSTLARRIAASTGLPLVHLDRLYWQPGWLEPEREAWLARLREELAKPAWIMDGNYGATLEERLHFADAALVLDYPMLLCLRRALWRVLSTRGRVRTDMGRDCPEHFDAEFLAYIVRFRQAQRTALLSAVRHFRGSKLILTSPRQRARIGEFLQCGKIR